MFSTLTSTLTYAQTKCDLVEKLPDESIIVKCDNNVSYKGLPPAQVRGVLKDRQELILIKRDYATQKQQYEAYKAESENKFNALSKREAEELAADNKQINYWQSEYGKENKLRLQYQKTLTGCSKFLWWRIC